MAKKKLPSKQYIAIDDATERVICVGTLKDIAEAIEQFSETEDWTADDIDCSVEVYELGEKMAFGVNTKIEIYF